MRMVVRLKAGEDHPIFDRTIGFFEWPDYLISFFSKVPEERICPLSITRLHPHTLSRGVIPYVRCFIRSREAAGPVQRVKPA